MFSGLLFHVKLMVASGRGGRAGARRGPGLAARPVGLARPVAGLLLPVALFSAAAGAFGACSAFCPRALSWRAGPGPVLPPVTCRWLCGAVQPLAALSWACLGVWGVAVRMRLCAVAALPVGSGGASRWGFCWFVPSVMMPWDKHHCVLF